MIKTCQHNVFVVIAQVNIGNFVRRRYQATRVTYRGGENTTWVLDTLPGLRTALRTLLKCAINRKAWPLRLLTSLGKQDIKKGYSCVFILDGPNLSLGRYAKRNGCLNLE